SRSASRELPRDRVEQRLGCLGDLIDGPVERVAMTGGWLPEAAQLADELERGLPDLIGRGDLGTLAETLDASAHAATLPRPRAQRRVSSRTRAAAWCARRPASSSGRRAGSPH